MDNEIKLLTAGIILSSTLVLLVYDLIKDTALVAFLG